MSLHTILIADTETIRRDSIYNTLFTHFYLVMANNEQEAIQTTVKQKPSLVLLDLKMNGIEVCQKIRAHEETQNTPIIIISNSEDESKCTNAFLAGADDFVSKLISSHELVARIMSKVCWHRQLKTSVSFGGIKLGNLILDEKRFKVLINKLPIKLTFFEYNLLKYLLINKDFVVSRNKILNDIWKENTVCPRTVDTHLYSLRKKLKDFDHEIITIHNAGYTLRARSTEQNTDDSLLCVS